MNIKNNNLMDYVSPDSSLILLKGSAEVSHGGGDALGVNSAIVRDWIVEGGQNN